MFPKAIRQKIRFFSASSLSVIANTKTFHYNKNVFVHLLPLSVQLFIRR